MGLFWKNSDERLIAKFEKEEKRMLKDNYDLMEGQTAYPEKSHLLKPERIFATSYEIIERDKAKINIGYKSNYSGYVTDTIRMNYERIIKGAILCENVISIRELPYTPASKIVRSSNGRNKIVTFPVRDVMSVSIECQKILIEEIDIYVLQDDRLILDSEYCQILKAHFEKTK